MYLLMGQEGECHDPSDETVDFGVIVVGYRHPQSLHLAPYCLCPMEQATLELNLWVRTNTRGTCLMLSSCPRTNACMLKSWLKGCLTTLKVPSTYQTLAFASSWSCLSVAKRRCRRSLLEMSARKKSDDM